VALDKAPCEQRILLSQLSAYDLTCRVWRAPCLRCIWSRSREAGGEGDLVASGGFGPVQRAVGGGEQVDQSDAVGSHDRRADGDRQQAKLLILTEPGQLFQQACDDQGLIPAQQRQP